MGGRDRTRPAAESATALQMIAVQTRQRRSLQVWNGISAVGSILYAGGVSLVGESGAFTWGLTVAGLGACAAVLFLSRRGRQTGAGWLLLGAWLVALTGLGIRHGPLSLGLLGAVIPIWAATMALSSPAGLVAGSSFAVSEIVLIALVTAGWGPLSAHAQQVTDSGLVVGYPLLMIAAGITGWLLARAAERAVNHVSALARSSEQGQQTLENRAIERSRKVQEANRQLARHAKQIEASARIARLVSQRVPLGELFQESARMLRAQLGFYHVLVYSLSADERHLILRASDGAAGKGLMERMAETDLDERSATGRAIGSQQPVIVFGRGEESKPAPELHLPLAQSWGAFPFIYSGAAIGVIELYSEQANPFDGAMLAVMNTVASLLALAVADSRRPPAMAAGPELDAASASRLEEISEAGSVAEVGQSLMDTIASTPAALARLLLMERDRAGVEWIVLRASWAAGEKLAEPSGTRLRLDDYPWAVFLSRTDPVVVEDIQTDRRATEAARVAARMAEIRSMIAIPLVAGTEWLGTWLVGRAEPSAFEGPLVRRYLQMARMAAVTLDRLRLRETVRHQRQQERLRAAVAGPLAAPSSAQELLESTVQAVGRILGAPRVAVYAGSVREGADGE